MRLAIAATLLLGAATAANAVSFTSSPGWPDPGPGPGETIKVDFDNPNAPGYSWSGGIATAIGTTPGVAAAPAGNTTIYGYVSSSINPNTATLDTPNLRSISFYWGSIDTYNTVEFLDIMGNVIGSAIAGGDFSAADGNQLAPGTNRRVFFVADPGNPISGVRFTSTGVAFEFDDFAAAAVPEPATWAMLIAGFGLIGTAMRRRRSLVHVPV